MARKFITFNNNVRRAARFPRRASPTSRTDRNVKSEKSVGSEIRISSNRFVPYGRCTAGTSHTNALELSHMYRTSFAERQVKHSKPRHHQFTVISNCAECENTSRFSSRRRFLSLLLSSSFLPSLRGCSFADGSSSREAIARTFESPPR